MKLNKIMILGLLLLVIGLNNRLNAQNSFYVTDTLLRSSSGSLDSVLIKAVQRANTGQNVTVYFNAPGLCKMNYPIATINVTNGSLTMKKDPSASMPQGLRYDTITNNSAITYGLLIQNTSISTSILIDSLTFTDFTTKTAIYLVNNCNLTIQNCIFNKNNFSIYYTNRSKNVTIKNNTFTYSPYSINFTARYDMGSTTNWSSTIMDNSFDQPLNDVTGLYAIAFAKSTLLPTNYFLNYKLNIIGNSINGYNSGITLNNAYGSNLDDTTLLINVKKNSINSNTGFIIINPLNKMEIDSNQISCLIYNIFMQSSLDTITPNPYGLDLVGPNTLGIPVVNGHNTFSDIGIAIRNQGFFGKGVNIVGLDLNNRVEISGGRYTNVRECKIASVEDNNLPIRHRLLTTNNQYGNLAIGSATMYSAAITCATLQVKYKLLGIRHVNENGPFVVEFYNSNTRGDLLKFLGSSTVSNLPSDTIVWMYNIPYGDTITRLAATVTSLGTNQTPAKPIGTSAAAYKNVTQPTSSCFHCKEIVFCVPDMICKGESFSVTNTSWGCSNNTPYFLWNYGDGTESTTETSHTYATTGSYTITMSIPSSNQSVTKSVTVGDCNHPCIDCIGSYSPEPDEDYVLSAWVMEENASPSKTAYTYPSIKLTFTVGTTESSQIFTPEGKIIDGWQRIEQKFHIPENTTGLKIELLSASGNCLFDDIRVFPFNGTMKSYVYDPVTLRLVAELDENNYATFYEYDEEGKLVRVKKETVKGVMTIKENKNSSVKKN